MARQYCSIEDVKKYLPDTIEYAVALIQNPMSPNKKIITEETIGFFIEQAAQQIDGFLMTQYEVPLKKHNYDGTVSYPAPIENICALLAAELIFEQRLMGGDKLKSESNKDRENWVIGQLTMIQNGEILLSGQKFLRSSRFVKNSLYNFPRNPAKDGTSQGKK